MGSGIEPVSDGCTGFWFAEWLFPIRQCCVDHDFGGTDGMLLDCLLFNTPSWAWPAVAACVALMILLRPLYHLLKRRRQ